MIPEITIPFFHSLVHSFSKREEKKKKTPGFSIPERSDRVSN